MNIFFLSIVILYILLCPFYIFDSGSPQPADFIVALGTIVFVFSKNFREIFSDKIVQILVKFILLVAFINIIYFLIFTAQGIDNRMFMPALFYIFNFFFYLIIFFVLKRNTQSINIISIIIVLSLLIQVLLAVLGIQGGPKEELTSRAIIFFNNPNQLGYFALLMLSLFTVLPSKFRDNIFAILFTVTLTATLILYSGSRAAMVGVLFLGIILLFQIGRKYLISLVAIGIVALFALPYLYQTDFIQKKVDLLESRNNRYVNTNISQAQIRGYDRFWIHPEYVFLGSGEGQYNRFNSYHNLEMHSGFGTILFSYGILGFLLFIYFLYKTIETNKLFNFLLLIPVLLYNITHQGLRTSLFWALLAAMYVISHNKLKLNSLKKNEE